MLVLCEALCGAWDYVAFASMLYYAVRSSFNSRKIDYKLEREGERDRLTIYNIPSCCKKSKGNHGFPCQDSDAVGQRGKQED